MPRCSQPPGGWASRFRPHNGCRRGGGPTPFGTLWWSDSCSFTPCVARVASVAPDFDGEEFMAQVANVGAHRRAPASAVPSRGFRTDIEGLRAVAVLGVLAYHAAVPFLPGGYVGVDVFFVISGFLITDMIH